MSTQLVERHPEAILMASKLEETRDAVAGEFFVKRKRTRYLKHPSSVDSTSAEASIRYEIYLDNAEFDGYPAQTLESMTGRMKFDAATIELPDRLNYLIESSDGDGVSLSGAMQNSASEIAQVLWQVLVVDYKGLTDVNAESLSIADIEQLNPRATIKAYSRENVIDWHYDRVNGKMQLVYIMLLEKTYKFTPDTQNREVVESFLILALDENGNYYQRKMVRSNDQALTPSERSYVKVSGQSLKWLPVLVASDKELLAGRMPLKMGYLSRICDISMMRYRMSAEYKETMRNLPPTTYTKGWTGNDHDVFKEINGGRDFIITGSGSVNNLPSSVTVEIVGVNAQVEPYERYFERSKSEARSMGAVIPESSEAAKTATEVSNAASEQNAVLSMIADSLEAVYTRLCLYCGMFEGLWGQDAIEQNMDKVSIVLPRDFANIKLSAQDRAAILNEHLGGLITKEEALLQLEAGGVLATDAETILNASDSGE
jgi:hypothetical protein